MKYTQRNLNASMRGKRPGTNGRTQQWSEAALSQRALDIISLTYTRSNLSDLFGSQEAK